MEAITNQTELPQTNQTNESYTTFSDYTNARLSCTPSEQKTIPNTGPQANPPTAPQYYFQVPLMYDFGSPDKKMMRDFLLEGCEMETKFGIQSKQGPSGRMESSIMCSYDTNNPDHHKWIETMNLIHSGCAYILQAMKGVVKLYNFDAKMAEATGMKHPVYRPRDELTGDIIQGRAPSMFLKLFSRGKPPMVEETLFTDIHGKPIPWSLLRMVEMKFIPLIHIKRIYIGGGKCSIQMEVSSAIVTAVRARGSTTLQLTTIHRLQQTRPELADTVAAQLAKLTTDRQDQLMDGQISQSNQQATTENQPTFAGLVPTGTRQMTAINNGQSMPTPGTLPAIPALGGMQPSMQDFTATAPGRAPVIPAVMTGLNRGTPSPSTIQLN